MYPGLQNTTINHIAHIDKLYLSRLAARRKILEDHPNAIACLPSATGMVNELYSYLTSTYLPARYPTIFHLAPPGSTATHLLNTLTLDLLPLTPPSDPLVALRSLVTTLDDDFIMLLPSSPSSPSEDNTPFSLQAYIWCYPAGFVPRNLLGLPLAAIHAPVPGYASKLEKSMDRYFSRLEVGRVVTRTNVSPLGPYFPFTSLPVSYFPIWSDRDTQAKTHHPLQWSIATTPNLWEDGLNGSHHLYENQDPSLTGSEIDIAQCYLRCELQTLFALPGSGGRVLGLHLYMYPLTEIKEEKAKDGEKSVAEELCQAIDGLTKGNVPEMWRYKRAVVWVEMVREFLRS
jgi:hypothetical protein